MKLPEKFWIVIHSEAHSKLVQDKLFELGYRWKYDGYKQPTIGENPHNPYGDLAINARFKDELGFATKEFYANAYDYGDQISTDDLLSVKANKQETVRLNDEHEAIVSSDGTIKVGCQTFSHEIVKSLAQAIEEVTK